MKLMENARLSYLDDIMKELAKNSGSFVSEDDVAPKVTFEKIKHKVFGEISVTKANIPVDKERLFFRTATIYLVELGLIMRQDKNPLNPDYLISYKGLELIENGGILKQRNNERVKDVLQKFFWILAFITFLVNTTFQILNYNKPATNTSASSTKEVQAEQE
ncbi:hypothetical protein R1T16_01960 [Flavobacterium sp. DG1-102-2]|uniref:hypothetical protein n=1 Tax=Flavobacterium sp. DG1-102-2 TaxID=3081663 RepID=UPI00294A1121|nr:hypothetical protein [Flavobacterium sp. DG1-102-2]MDV6167170.1 hypothetical protein [Flavobacterium sp. DG1-102-2]